MNRHDFFLKRMRELGAFDADSDYNGMIGKAVERVSAIWAAEGHSGASSAITLQLLNQLFSEYENQPLESNAHGIGQSAAPALRVLASMDEWLGNKEGLMIEDVIEWREALASALSQPPRG